MPSGDREEWLRTWLPKLTRCLKHSGNYKYGWAIARGARRYLPDSLPYPKHGGLLDFPPVSIVRADLESKP